MKFLCEISLVSQISLGLLKQMPENRHPPCEISDKTLLQAD